MILITGGSGFIGSNVIEALNNNGIDDIIVVDELDSTSKWTNLSDKSFIDLIDWHKLFNELPNYHIEAVVHLGACTDTTENDAMKMLESNLSFSKKIWRYCSEYKIKLIYASSAAVYGNGEKGFSENLELNKLIPLNLYAFSKLQFDRFAVKQSSMPPKWAGLRFFNVYGPGENHKGKMASMVYHFYNQINETGKVKLFKSYRDDYFDGEQMRDFVYVKDVAEIISFLLSDDFYPSGFYNIGTGQAHSFNELAETVFAAFGNNINIEYVDMPKELQLKYQYYTEADISKLRSIGYNKDFMDIKKGITNYILDLS